MKIIHLEQNTDEWLIWRSGGIGGSDAPAIMGVSPWDTPLSLWQRRLGKVPPKEMSVAMMRGHELEPIARALLSRRTGMIFEPVCCEHDTVSWLKASLDGLEIQRRAIAEIKAPGEEDHNLAKQGIVPAKYWPQLQHQMVVSGIKRTFYASYRPEDEEEQLAVVEVFADEIYQRLLVQTEAIWWKAYKEQKIPVAQDHLARALAWRQLKVLADQYDSMLKEAQTTLLDAVGFDVESLVAGKKDLGFVKVSAFDVKGSVDWEAAMSHFGINEDDLEQFRGPKSVRVRISKTSEVRAKATAEDFFGPERTAS